MSHHVILSVAYYCSTGMRVTDTATVEVAEMVLSGLLNKRTVHEIGLAGGNAVGLSGKDNGLMRCVPLDPELGLVGDPVEINTGFLEDMLFNGLIPVIAPIGQGLEGDASTYNVNADVAASVVAKKLEASRLLLLTDVAGVLDKDKQLIPRLTAADIKRLVEDGTISGGMIPKVEMALDAAQGGVAEAVILDGRIPHAVRRSFNWACLTTIFSLINSHARFFTTCSVKRAPEHQLLRLNNFDSLGFSTVCLFSCIGPMPFFRCSLRAQLDFEEDKCASWRARGRLKYLS